jgi:hypothetical protein
VPAFRHSRKIFTYNSTIPDNSFSFIKRPYVDLLALDYFFQGGRFGLNYAEKSIS